MTDPVAQPMKIDAKDESEDLNEEWGETDGPDSLPPAEADWVEENEGSDAVSE